MVVGIICAILVVALFSGFTLVSRMGHAADLPVADLAALRFGIGGLILAPVLFLRGTAGISTRNMLWLAFCGGLGFALLAYSGFYLAPAAHGAVLLHGTLPLTTFLITCFVDPSQVRRAALPGIALITFGILLMAWSSMITADARQLAGDGLLLLASFCWSTYGVSARRLGLQPLHAAAIVATISMACFLPPYLIAQGASILNHPWQDLLTQAVFQGVLIGVLSIFVYTQAVVNLGASETALFTAAIPGITALGALFLLGEKPAPVEWAGVVIGSIGMLIAIRALYRPTRRSS